MKNMSAAVDDDAVRSFNLNRPDSVEKTAAADISLPTKQAQSLVCHSALLNAISEAVISTDTAFVIQSWNRAAEKIFQVNAAQAIGKNLQEVLRFTMVNGSFEDAVHATITHGHWMGESHLHCPDGTDLYLRTTANVIRDEQGQLIGFVATSRDISDIKQANENLQKERFLNLQLKKAKRRLSSLQSQFNAFMDHSTAISWIVDNKGIFHYFNPLFLKIFKLSESDIGKHVTEIFPPEVAAEYLRNNAIVFETGVPLDVTEIGEEPNGKKTIYKVLKFPLHIVGKKKYQGGIAIDITQDLEYQEQLALSNERFRLVNKATSDIIWDWDVTNDEILMGESFDLTHQDGSAPYRMADSLAKVCEADRKRVTRSLFKAVNNANVHFWSEEYEVTCKNENCKTVNDKAFIIRDENGKALRVIGAVQDITEKKELQHQLVEQEKNKQKEIVKAVMSAQEKERQEIAYELHDNVNQLLTTCKLQLEAAEYFRQDAGYLARISSYMQNIIDEIRTITHQLNPQNLQAMGLCASVKDIVCKLNSTGRLQVKFSCTNSEAIPLDKEIELAAFRMVQEQVQNIIKHSGARNASIQLQTDSSELHICIKDDGIGFSMQEKKSGLGLVNIINRAEYFGGMASIRSAKGEGCEINIYLPVELSF